MEKKYQIIYIWSFIIVSSLILLMLYTPLGGDLHQSDSDQYSIANTSVNFEGRISNLPKRNYSQQSTSGDNNLPSHSSRNFKSASVHSNRGAINNLPNNGSSVNSKRTLSSAQSTGGSNGNIAAASSTFGGGKLNASSSSNSQSEVDNSPFSTSTPNSGSVMQRNNNETTDNLSDPGGDELVGDPLPIGDGLYLLISMALVYVFRLKKKLI